MRPRFSVMTGVVFALAVWPLPSATGGVGQPKSENPLAQVLQPFIVTIYYTQYGYEPAGEDQDMTRGYGAVQVRNDFPLDGQTIRMTLVKRNGRTKDLVSGALALGPTMTRFRKWRVGEQLVIHIERAPEVIYDKTLHVVSPP